MPNFNQFFREVVTYDSMKIHPMPPTDTEMSSSPTEVYLNNYLTLLKQFSDFG